jgi:hypothetical protein
VTKRRVFGFVVWAVRRAGRRASPQTIIMPIRFNVLLTAALS